MVSGGMLGSSMSMAAQSSPSQWPRMRWANSCSTNCWRWRVESVRARRITSVSLANQIAQMSVAGVEVVEFLHAQGALASGLDRVDEVVEGEGVAELEVRDGRRYGLLDIHGAPLSVESTWPVSASRCAIPVSAQACVSFPHPGTW